MNRVFGEWSTNKVTVGRWFSKFSKGDFDQNDPRRKPEPKVKNDDLRAAVEQTHRKLLLN